jgi:hypothetical protein
MLDIDDYFTHIKIFVVSSVFAARHIGNMKTCNRIDAWPAFYRKTSGGLSDIAAAMLLIIYGDTYDAHAKSVPGLCW